MAYSFRIKERNTNKYVNLDDVDNTDMMGFVRDFLGTWTRRFFTNANSIKAFTVL